MCNLVGFTDIDQINDELEQECEEAPPSNVAILFMIRGLCTSYEFPYAPL